MKAEVIKPWIPIEVMENKTEIYTNLWGRSYTSSEKSFLSSIKSQGKEILAAPIRLVGTENGKEIVWEATQNFVMNASNGEKTTICSTTQSDAFILNTVMNIEYDGCIDLGISIMPQGRSVKQSLGMGKLGERQFNLSR